MDAAEYKHVVLGLMFLKYISDVFAELHNKLVEGQREFEGANPEGPDEYLAYNKVLCIPNKILSLLFNGSLKGLIGGGFIVIKKAF